MSYINKQTNLLLWLYNPFYYSNYLEQNLVFCNEMTCKIFSFSNTSSIIVKPTLYSLLHRIFKGIISETIDLEQLIITVNMNIKEICISNKINIIEFSNNLIKIAFDNIKLIYKNSDSIKFIDSCPVNTSAYINSIRMNYIKQKQLSHGDHESLPLPHPTLGRPTFDMKKCLCRGCNYTTFYNASLANHLHMNMPNFKDYYHCFHEELIQMNYITPDKIMLQNITKCPSLNCKIAYSIPEELIYHFEELGIIPFWYTGWKPKDFEDNANNIKLNEIKVQDNINLKEIISINDEINDDLLCVCCLSNFKNAICIPCGHQVLCFNCYGEQIKKGKKECVICRTKCDHIIPAII